MPMAGHAVMGERATELRGRLSECAVLDGLLDAVRRGDSQALVVRGDPGVGKTALLEYLTEQASDCRVLRAAGVQSEMELAFAALHQLLAPMLDRLDRLPAPQRDALRTAFGLGAGAAPDRFLVALAVLSLLSEVAEERPLVCVVDDEQWLDRASARALAFAARRVDAESVGLVFASRGPDAALAELPELVVGGLREADGRELLASVLTAPLDARIRDQIVSETRGNPLALLELPRGLTPAELAGGFGLPSTASLSTSIEDSFGRRLNALPADTRRLLALAAADPVGDPTLVWRAAERLAIEPRAAGPAVEAGLVEFGAQVRFRHPLVRSAAYRSTSPEERHVAHAALAEVTDPQIDPDRRAWHQAQATAGPDEQVAEELERSADRAQSRGGLAAAAAFLERSVTLTLDPVRRAQRALAAAQAEHRAGAADTALGLLATAEAGPLDELARARVDMLRAQIAYVSRRGGNAPELLLRAAKRLEPLDVGLARQTYLDALSAGIFAGRVPGAITSVDVAKAALVAPPPTGSPCATDLLLEGVAREFTEGYAAAAPTLKRALSAFRDGQLSSEEQLHWTFLAWRTACLLWDDESIDVLAVAHVKLAREVGALTELPLALTGCIYADTFAGELGRASALVGELRSISEVIGIDPPPYGPVFLAAWQGRDIEASRLIETTMNEVGARDETLGLSAAQWASAVLFNGLGRYEEALAAAERSSERPEDSGFHEWGVVERIEAAVRSGQPERAPDLVRRLANTTRISGTDWGLGIEARCRALVSEGEIADGLYREAIDRLARTRVRGELARAHLLYGEWLRRERRRVDAREQLRTAHEMLEAMGAEAFADRARRELGATGETVCKRTVQTRDELTAQEAQIARLACDGLSNPEIGTRLFISPRTVKYHLRKVFTKLDISSRHELEHALPSAPAAVRPL